ncbi:MAG: sigma-70 family RNA polymerase sigma factor [Eubacterium sp.]|nr:sigma-70 family RNA polymerase sigma factor [Eubacterium sp.]
MDDKRIIDLYLARNERAIEETDSRYGEFSRNLSFRILNSHEDVEECINDAYLRLWNSIPPTVPNSLKAYLGRIVRNLSLNRLRWKTEKKRDCDANVLLSEISDCIPAKENVEQTVDQKLLSELITKWLSEEKKVNRRIFVRRYWYGSSYRELE